MKALLQERSIPFLRFGHPCVCHHGLHLTVLGEMLLLGCLQTSSLCAEHLRVLLAPTSANDAAWSPEQRSTAPGSTRSAEWNLPQFVDGRCHFGFDFDRLAQMEWHEASTS